VYRTSASSTAAQSPVRAIKAAAEAFEHTNAVSSGARAAVSWRALNSAGSASGDASEELKSIASLASSKPDHATPRKAPTLGMGSAAVGARPTQ